MKVHVRDTLLVLVLLSGITIELGTLVQLATFPSQLNILATLSDSEGEFQHSLTPLSPIIVVGLLSAPIFLFGMWEARRRITQSWFRAGLGKLSAMFAVLRAVGSKDLSALSIGPNHPRIMLLMAVVSSALLVYTPYRTDLNPGSTPVGIDTPLYTSWVSQMLGKAPLGAFAYAFSEAGFGSRPIFLIVLYSTAALGGIKADLLVQLLPMALAPLLCLSSYVFVWSGQRIESLAGLTAILTAFSFNITVGGLLLTHPWTWIVILATSLVFLITMRRESGGLIRLGSVVSIIVTGFIVDIFKGLFFGSRTVGADLSTKTVVFGPSQLATFWPNVVGTMLTFYDGLLSSSLFLVLGAFAFLAMRYADRFDRLLMTWVGCSALPFPFFNSFHQTRLIYDLPLPVLAAVGLSLVGYKLRPLYARLPTMFVLFTILFQANYALRAMLHL